MRCLSRPFPLFSLSLLIRRVDVFCGQCARHGFFVRYLGEYFKVYYTGYFLYDGVQSSPPAEASRGVLTAIIDVQSAEVTGSKPRVEHLYIAIMMTTRLRPTKMSRGTVRSIVPSLNCLKIFPIFMSDLIGFITAIPVIIIENILRFEPDIHIMNAVIGMLFPGDCAICIALRCFSFKFAPFLLLL